MGKRRGKEAEGWEWAGKDMDGRKEEAKKRGRETVGGERKKASKDGSAEGDARGMQGRCTRAAQAMRGGPRGPKLGGHTDHEVT